MLEGCIDSPLVHEETEVQGSQGEGSISGSWLALWDVKAEKREIALSGSWRLS